MQERKLISFAVPCYNSETYMDGCIQSLLTAKEDIEIIIIDDGSKDGTGAIADEYARQYPDIVRAVHQMNGGHGEGVNVGLAHANGLYYKVVDSDDKLDAAALARLMRILREHLAKGCEADLYIVNFVYDKALEGREFTRHYKKQIPVNTLCGWESVKRFHTSEMLLMHSLVYKTDLLKASGTVLPKHTFYVDNIFSYKPLPFMKKLYYLDVDLYRYFIGREDQSVNLHNIVRRYEQQIRVMKEMINAYSFEEISRMSKGLRRYMLHSLSVIMMLTQMFVSCGVTERKQRKQDLKALWRYIRCRDRRLYKKLRYRSYNALVAWMPFPLLRFTTLTGYKYYRRRLACS